MSGGVPERLDDCPSYCTSKLFSGFCVVCAPEKGDRGLLLGEVTRLTVNLGRLFDYAIESNFG